MIAPLAKQLGDWCAALDLTDIPESTCEIARRAIVDVIAVMLAGSQHPSVAAIRTALARARGPCTVVRGSPSNPAAAALVNGMAAHVWDFDDTSYTGILHGSAVV